MRVAGIIAEFNPFHTGHRYLIDTVRQQLKPDGIVAVMSGHFVQRGEPAMWDKWTRAACAVENGVDLVLELPICYAVNSGEEFARGGIGILKGIGIVTDLAFGSESGQSVELERVAHFLAEEDAAFSSVLKENLSKGSSYPTAYEQAVLRRSSHSGKELKTMLRSPNDILALAYIKQMLYAQADFELFPVKRRGVGHDQTDPVSGYASASLIRRSITERLCDEEWKRYVPQKTYEILSTVRPFGETDRDRYDSLLRYVLLSKSSEELAGLISVTEGLENRLKESVARGRTSEELVRSIKTKRYTYARISRILVQALLGMSKKEYEVVRKEQAFYARVLGFNKKGARLLRTIADCAAAIPVYTNTRRVRSAVEAIRTSLDWDFLATDIYNVIRGDDGYAASDRVRKPYMSDVRTENLCTSNDRVV
jgi:predicted nucleotidyltransferase